MEVNCIVEPSRNDRLLHDGRLTRRSFLSGAAAAFVEFSAGTAWSALPVRDTPADITLRIGPVTFDVAHGKTISTTGYNGSVPGPLIRLREGVPVTVDLFNDLDAPELVHWHGQIIPAEVDGAEEENSLMVPAHGHLRYRLTPGPSGARWVHSHVMAGSDVSRGVYTGQFAFVYIEPRNNPGQYDQELFLAAHEFEPFFGAEEMEEGDEKDPETE